MKSRRSNFVVKFRN